MRGTDTQVENPSPCHEQLFLSGLCVDSRVIQQVLIVDFRCVKKHHFPSSFFFFQLLLSSFWTSRGHMCRPFSPPVLAFNFYRAYFIERF